MCVSCFPEIEPLFPSCKMNLHFSPHHIMESPLGIESIPGRQFVTLSYINSPLEFSHHTLQTKVLITFLKQKTTYITGKVESCEKLEIGNTHKFTHMMNKKENLHCFNIPGYHPYEWPPHAKWIFSPQEDYSPEDLTDKHEADKWSLKILWQSNPVNTNSHAELQERHRCVVHMVGPLKWIESKVRWLERWLSG